MHSVSAGYDREFLAIEDILTQSALPNQGRSKEQRYLGVGAYGGGAQQQNTRNEAIARVLYMHECNPAALRAGLISAVSDDPFCIMWLGGHIQHSQVCRCVPPAQNRANGCHFYRQPDLPQRRSRLYSRAMACVE